MERRHNREISIGQPTERCKPRHLGTVVPIQVVAAVSDNGPPPEPVAVGGMAKDDQVIYWHTDWSIIGMVSSKPRWHGHIKVVQFS